MSIRSVGIGVLLFVGLCLPGLAAESAAAKLQVTQPAGGTFYTNDVLVVRWTLTGLALENETLEISLWDGRSKKKLLNMTPAPISAKQTTYSWPIPATVSPGSYKVRVDVLKRRVKGDSVAFKVEARAGTAPGFAILESVQVMDPAAEKLHRDCEGYAGIAVSQNEANKTMKCGFHGNRWNSIRHEHYEWCIHGKNINFTRGQEQARSRELKLCREKPINGTIAIKSFTPKIGGSGVLESFMLTLEVKSSTPWQIGDFGDRLGSLWAELTVDNKVVSPDFKLQNSSLGWKFSFAAGRGGSAPLALRGYVDGRPYPAGVQLLTLAGSVSPQLQLKGVKGVWSTGGSGPMPGGAKELCFYPELELRVHAASASGGTLTATRTDVIKVALPSKPQGIDPPPSTMKGGPCY